MCEFRSGGAKSSSYAKRGNDTRENWFFRERGKKVSKKTFGQIFWFK